MGCRITLEVFSQQPASINSIVLLDGSWYGPAPKDYKPKSVDGAEELQNILNVFDTMMGPATPEVFKQQVQQHLRAIDLDYANQLRRDYIAWDGKRMEEVLGMVGSGTGPKVKVLVVQGTPRCKEKEFEKGPSGAMDGACEVQGWRWVRQCDRRRLRALASSRQVTGGGRSYRDVRESSLKLEIL
jgi:hypothetical protein